MGYGVRIFIGSGGRAFMQLVVPWVHPNPGTGLSSGERLTDFKKAGNTSPHSLRLPSGERRKDSKKARNTVVTPLLGFYILYHFELCAGYFHR